MNRPISSSLVLRPEAPALQKQVLKLGVLALRLALSLLILLSAQSGHAHDLEVDQFSYFPAESGDTLRGQLIFDPELTRAPQDHLSDNQAKERVLSFVKQQLTLHIDAHPCAPELEIRELYNKGGATAGDSVVILCPLSPSVPEHSLTVELGPDIRDLIVQGPRLGTDGQRQHSTLVHPNSHSPSLRFLSPGAQATPAQQAPSPPPPHSFYEVVLDYFKTGFLHILPLGADHVLFVIGIVLPATALRSVLLLLTGFTAAHTLTLALVSLEMIAPSPLGVEALIALSIALLGLENLFLPRNTLRYRMGLVVLFGLVHGMGFAGALRAIAPSLDDFSWALLGFNLGVEAGQIVVAGTLSALLISLRSRPALVEHLVQAGSWALVVIGSFWTITRLL